MGTERAHHRPDKDVGRHVAAPQTARSAPSIVHTALREPGTPLDAKVHRVGSHAHRDFSQVRLHAGPTAARSAAAISAEAYVVGGHVVLGSRTPRPGLLEHELTHVLQQVRTLDVPDDLRLGEPEDVAEQLARSRSAVGSPTEIPIVRRSMLSWIGGVASAAVHSLTGWSDQKLREYVDLLVRSHQIEGDPDSDDKARAVIGRTSLVASLTPEIKRLLVEELLDGPTTGADEMKIMDVLETASYADLVEIFRPGRRITRASLYGDIDGDAPRKRLDAFMASHIVPGTSRVLPAAPTPGAPVPAPPAQRPAPSPAVTPALEPTAIQSYPVKDLGAKLGDVERAVREGRRQDAIDIVVQVKVGDGSINLELIKDKRMVYRPGQAEVAYTPMPSWDYLADKVEAPPVYVGPKAFTSIPYLCSVLLHEYQHVLWRQSKTNVEYDKLAHDPQNQAQPTDEVEASCWEIEHAKETGLDRVPGKVLEIWDILMDDWGKTMFFPGQEQRKKDLIRRITGVRHLVVAMTKGGAAVRRFP